ncbi:MAG: hypothetical protein ACK5PP_15990 [Acidimicrobiales bacterium]
MTDGVPAPVAPGSQALAAGVGLLRQGRVLDYDPAAGLGTLVPGPTDPGGLPVGGTGPEPIVFHCTAIADGTRTIDPGRAVVYRTAAAGPGRWEATEVVPLGD